MRKKDKEIKKYIFIGIIVFIVLIIMVIILISKISNNNETDSPNYENAIEEVKEYFLEEGKIVPDNYNILTRLYEGEINDSDVYRKIYMLTYKTIPNTYENLSNATDEEIAKYYDKNTEKILDNTGIEEKEEYIAFVKEICKQEKGEYINSKFDVENYSSDEEYSKVDLEIEFTTGTICLEMQVRNTIGKEAENIKFIAKKE